MNKSIFALLTLSMITACDSPRTTTAKMLTAGNYGNSTNTSTFSLGSTSTITTPTTTTIQNPSTTTNNTASTTTSTTTATTPTTNSNIPTDATHCKFSSDGVNGFENDSIHLGPYTLCQSSTDTNSFYIQLKNPNVGVNICFIPNTTSTQNGQDLYIGNPQCIVPLADAKTVAKLTFYKFSQYSNASINSIIFFKDTAYYYPSIGQNTSTMNMYQLCIDQWQRTGNIIFCNDFKNVGQYVIKRFVL